MNRKKLQRRVWCVVGWYVTVLVAAVLCKRWCSPGYAVLKDFAIVTVVGPAALLAYWFQCRVSYLQAPRALFSRLIEAVNGAIQYAEHPCPTEAQHREVLGALAVVIDEVRGVFRNVSEPTSRVRYVQYASMESARAARRASAK